MTIDQISVFAENKQGSLCELLGILAEGGIDLRAISIADTNDFGILRMIVADPEAALKLFKDRGITASKTAVTGCKLPDTPGSLAAVMKTLSDADISVEYLYAFITRRHEDAYVILRVEDNALAQAALTAAGHTLIDPKELRNF